MEGEVRVLTRARRAADDLELCHAVAAIRGAEAKAARTEQHSPWRTSGWMPVGRRQRLFTFRHAHETGQEVSLQYGNGPAMLSIGERDFAFTFTSTEDGGFDLTLDGMKTRITAVFEGHEPSLRTRNGP